MKLLPLILFAPAIAHAWQFEAGAGVTSYQTVDSRWYQQSQLHQLGTTPAAWSLGITGDFSPWLAWHASYVDLGRATASCDCLTRDEDYAARRQGPQAVFSGRGATQGFALTLEPHTSVSGWRVGAEAGVYLGHTHWSESVTGWTVNDQPKQNLSLSSSYWQASPVVGASVGRDNWAVRYRHYFTSVGANKNVPPAFRDADVIEYVLKF